MLSLSGTIAEERGLSANAFEPLYSLIQEEMSDSTKYVSLDDAATHLKPSTQSARKYIGELLNVGLAVRTGTRPMKVRASEQLRKSLAI